MIDIGKGWMHVSTGDGEMRTQARNQQVHYGEGLVLLHGIPHSDGESRYKSFLSLSRAIIVRNGEIIPMSREFTPETERQRLQLLVSRG